jgi:hypothetical protein
LLVLATDLQDGYDKVKIILKRSAERNMILKLKKTWLGQRKVTFFSYECSAGSYAMSADRIKSIQVSAMPTSRKSMKRFLGCSGFFLPFMPNYSDLTCQLNDMAHQDFDWTKSTWKLDYEAIF